MSCGAFCQAITAATSLVSSNLTWSKKRSYLRISGFGPGQHHQKQREW